MAETITTYIGEYQKIKRAERLRKERRKQVAYALGGIFMAVLAVASLAAIFAKMIVLAFTSI